VLNGILKDAFAKTGLTPPAPYVGAHILRHRSRRIWREAALRWRR